QLQDIKALQSLAEQMARVNGKDKRAEAALRWANYAEATGNYPAAIVAAQRVITLAHNTRQAEKEVAGYLAWGRSLRRQGIYDEAQDVFQQALAQSQTTELENHEASSLKLLGNCLVETNHFETAMQHLQQALTLYRHIGDRQGECDVVNDLGNVYLSQGDIASALINWEEARRIYEEVGHREGLARALLNLGVGYMDAGRYHVAASLFEQALRICNEIDVPFGACLALSNLCYLYCQIDSMPESIAAGTQSLAIAQELNSQYLQGIVTFHLGAAYLVDQQPQIAAEKYRESLAIWEDLQNSSWIMEAKAGLARIALAKNRLQEAQAHVEAILALFAQGVSVSELLVHFTCYRVLIAVNDKRAVDILETAYNALQDKAALITDDALRTSQLENVPTHRQIVEAYRPYK
ncbi:MAG: tetratricopeptide repeat protein, partial [Chloroflexi bacterium]|nr:tetratricopeptide repeat protein [Chloroflexota bacterium]